MKQFTDLMAAIRVLRGAQKQTTEYAGGPFNNPAWDKVQHAMTYLEKQAKEVL